MSDDLNRIFDAIARAARAGRTAAARLSSAQKSAALHAAADAIGERRDEILAINAREKAEAVARATSPAFVDRMALDAARLDAIIVATRIIADLPDPVGAEIRRWSQPNGLQFRRVRTPIGVIAMIYESRPNVTIDAAAIALKSGNAVILRGGSECIRTSSALHAAFVAGLERAGVDARVAQFIVSPDRAIVGGLLEGLGGAVDLIIPRGGRSLVARVQQEARAPVLAHLEGVCHVYVDKAADLQKALAVVVDAKMRRVGVCGAMETLLVDRAGADALLPPLAAAFAAKGCELRGDAAARALAPMAAADEDDWRREYLAPILAVAIVDGVAGAIAHIAAYGSAHTDAIVTEDQTAAAQFLGEVDSAIVLHNASTQFADGGEFGFGCEIGIATGKLHARGPVGVEELTTYKTIVIGDGHARG
jgi:glutamate-5-semialdehyde dehydrogenase